MDHNFLLNYKFQEIDQRDYIHPANLKANAPVPKLPKSVYVSNSNNIVVMNQGDLGSCVANVFMQCISIMTNKGVSGSRLFMYFNGRAVANYPIDYDTGLTVRDGCKSISKYGLCGESKWPYTISLFANLPSLDAYKSSLLFKNYSYSFVNQDINSIKNCINTTKKPIIFGINVYSSFLSSSVTKTGIVPLPNTKTEELLGGHCVLMIGYDDSKQWVVCVNSWGTGWGNKGLFYLPYAYITNPALSSDFCILTFSYSNLTSVQPSFISNGQKLSILKKLFLKNKVKPLSEMKFMTSIV